MIVELQTLNIGQDRLKQRLPLNKREACGVAAIKMQKVEGIKDQTHAARRAPSVAAWVSAKFGRPSSPTPHNSPSR